MDAVHAVIDVHVTFQGRPLISISVTSNDALPLMVTRFEVEAVTLAVARENPPAKSFAATALAMAGCATARNRLTLSGLPAVTAPGVRPLARKESFLASINGSQLAASIGALGPTASSL